MTQSRVHHWELKRETYRQVVSEEKRPAHTALEVSAHLVEFGTETGALAEVMQRLRRYRSPTHSAETIHGAMLFIGTLSVPVRPIHRCVVPCYYL